MRWRGEGVAGTHDFDEQTGKGPLHKKPSRALARRLHTIREAQKTVAAQKAAMQALKSRR